MFIETATPSALSIVHAAISEDVLKCDCKVHRIKLDVVDMPTYEEVIRVLQEAVLPPYHHRAQSFKIKLPSRFYTDDGDVDLDAGDEDGRRPFYTLDIRAPTTDLLLQLGALLSRSFYNIVRVTFAYELFADDEEVLGEMKEFFHEDSLQKKSKIAVERHATSVVVTRKLKRKQLCKRGLIEMCDLVAYDGTNIVKDLRLS